ncbi:MAG: hypothetical protein KF716_08790 [Anaerolineae bacterium]|nr:hypothetical protein [Anaerolineae bacterium]
MLFLGRYVENRLSEFDKDSKPKHKLKDLLADRETLMDAYDAVAMLKQIPGAVRVRRVKRKAGATQQTASDGATPSAEG